MVPFSGWAGGRKERMKFVYNDGGRAASGFTGTSGDCVCRAIAIAAGRDYQVVYDELNHETSMDTNASGKASARTGIPRSTFAPYLDSLGFEWFPTMRVGSGTKVHLKADELPRGMIIVRLSKHLCAVEDGVILDTHDPSRDETRCVYGYWKRT